MKILMGQPRGLTPWLAPGSAPRSSSVSARDPLRGRLLRLATWPLRDQLWDGGGEEENKKGHPFSETTLEMYKDFARNGILTKS